MKLTICALLLASATAFSPAVSGPPLGMNEFGPDAKDVKPSNNPVPPMDMTGGQGELLNSERLGPHHGHQGGEYNDWSGRTPFDN